MPSKTNKQSVTREMREEASAKARKKALASDRAERERFNKLLSQLDRSLERMGTQQQEIERLARETRAALRRLRAA